MIYYYVGGTGSYMGTTVSGVTFSNGVEVMGVSGSATSFETTTKSGNLSHIGGTTPIVFINTFPGGTTNYTLPDNPPVGTTIMVRRTDTALTGTTNLLGG